jgi:energy-coupling factor transporter ATP-binding protein EcfA2
MGWKIHEYLKDLEIYRVWIPLDPSREREKHNALSELFLSFLKKSGKDFKIILLLNEGNASLYIIMDGGIETLNTVYSGIVFNKIDNINIADFEDLYIFKSIRRKEPIIANGRIVDFFEHILKYSNSLTKPSFVISVELIHLLFNTDFFGIRILTAFKKNEKNEDLISLISSYWSDKNNLYAVKKKTIRGKTGLIDSRGSSFILPFPGEALERSGIAIRAQGFSTPVNILKSVYIGRSVSNSKPCHMEFLKNEGQSTLLLGETGSGKSTLMVSVFKSLSELNFPILVLDPTGDTVERIMGSMDEKIANRVVYISPVDSPVSMNLLEIPGYIDREIAVTRLAEDIIQVLRNVTEAESGIQGGLVGSRIEEILRHSINGLVELKGSTIMDIYDIITREDSRKNFMKISENEDFKEFLSNLENFTQEDISSTRRTLSFIKANRILKSMVANRNPAFSIYDAIKNNNIILVSGDRGKVSEKVSTFILSTILSMFWISLQSRKEKLPAFLFCDEFQEYANSSFQDMLILGRKENLNLFMATTHLSTIQNNLKDTIMANAKNYALFKLSPGDAIDFSLKFSIDRERLMFLGGGVAFFKSRIFSEFIRIDFNEAKSMVKDYFIKESKRYINQNDDFEEIFYDMLLLEHMHLEVNIQNLKSIYERIGEERDVFHSIEKLKKSGYIYIDDNNKININTKVLKGIKGKIINKLLLIGNIVRIENENPLVIRCIPIVPNIKESDFYVYLDPEGNFDGVKIFSGEKKDCEECYSIEEFLSIDANPKLLMDLGGILSCVDEDVLVTTSKRIANALRDYSDYYKNYPDLERAVRKIILDNGLGEDAERIVIGDDRVRTLRVYISKIRNRFVKYNFKKIDSLKIKQ